MEDRFGGSKAALGDVDSDGVVELAVGAGLDDDGGSIAGAAYILFIKTDGVIKNAQKLSALYGNFNAFYTLIANDFFGRSIAAPGDINGDGVVDMAVGAVYDTDGGSLAGAVYLFFLETDGTCKSAQKLSNLYGNLNTYYTLAASDHFGVPMASLEDLDGDSVVDLAMGAYRDDDGGTDAGAAYILFLDTDGTVKGAKKSCQIRMGPSTYSTLSVQVFYLDLGWQHWVISMATVLWIWLWVSTMMMMEVLLRAQCTQCFSVVTGPQRMLKRCPTITVISTHYTQSTRMIDLAWHWRRLVISMVIT